MALKVNFRILLFFLVVIVILNFGQLFMNVKKESEKPEHVNSPIAVIEVKEYLKISDGISSLNKVKVSKEDIKASTISSTIDNETCPTTDTYLTEINENSVDLCPQIPPGLGLETPPLPVAINIISEEIQPGGFFKPQACLARQQIAVIVPFSGSNKKVLLNFLHHIHTFLMKQQSNYQIYVIEYENNGNDDSFNRGHLFNVGVAEAQKQRSEWQCLILHDPHLVPLDSRNLYRCSWYPRQLVSTVNLDSPGTKHHPMLGGGIAITPEQYAKVNGFTNNFLGRDCDYIDFYNRLQWSNYTLERSDPAIGIYRSIGAQPYANDTFHSVVMTPFHLLDGLTTLSYDLVEIGLKKLYTGIRVSVNSQEQTSKLLSKILGPVLNNDSTK